MAYLKSAIALPITAPLITCSRSFSTLINNSFSLCLPVAMASVSPPSSVLYGNGEQHDTSVLWQPKIQSGTGLTFFPGQLKGTDLCSNTPSRAPHPHHLALTDNQSNYLHASKDLPPKRDNESSIKDSGRINHHVRWFGCVSVEWGLIKTNNFYEMSAQWILYLHVSRTQLKIGKKFGHLGTLLVVSVN